MTITEYKEKYGTTYKLIERVYHKCGICGASMLFDSDAIAGHVVLQEKLRTFNTLNNYSCETYTIPIKLEAK